MLAVSAESDALAVTSAALIAAINANDKVCNIGLLSGFFCVLQRHETPNHVMTNKFLSSKPSASPPFALTGSNAHLGVA